MCRLREAIRQKRLELWKNLLWILNHDNASAHTSKHVCEFLAENKTIIMPQPPYLPDLVRFVTISKKGPSHVNDILKENALTRF